MERNKNITNKKKVQQIRVNDYAYGVWFNVIEIDPWNDTVVIWDHIFERKQMFFGLDSRIESREIFVTETYKHE